MNTKHLDYILEIEKKGTLSDAAKSLGISQPALSKFLQKQEAELKTPLFFTINKKLVPTPAGKIYLNAAAQIVQIKATTYARIASSLQHRETEISIGASAYSGSIIISQVLPKFCEKYPGINVRITEGKSCDTIRSLLRGKVTAGIITLPADHDDRFLFYSFEKTELCLLVPSAQIGLISKKDYEINPENYQEYIIRNPNLLRNLPFILPSDNIFLKEEISGLFQKAQIEPTVIYNTDNIFVTMRLVEKGFGAGFMHLSYVRKHPSDGYVTMLFPQHHYVYAGMAVPRKNEANEALSFLISLILDFKINEAPNRFDVLDGFNAESIRFLNRRNP